MRVDLRSTGFRPVSGTPGPRSDRTGVRRPTPTGGSARPGGGGYRSALSFHVRPTLGPVPLRTFVTPAAQITPAESLLSSSAVSRTPDRTPGVGGADLGSGDTKSTDVSPGVPRLGQSLCRPRTSRLSSEEVGRDGASRRSSPRTTASTVFEEDPRVRFWTFRPGRRRRFPS